MKKRKIVKGDYENIRSHNASQDKETGREMLLQDVEDLDNVWNNWSEKPFEPEEEDDENKRSPIPVFGNFHIQETELEETPALSEPYQETESINERIAKDLETTWQEFVEVASPEVKLHCYWKTAQEGGLFERKSLMVFFNFLQIEDLKRFELQRKEPEENPLDILEKKRREELALDKEREEQRWLEWKRKEKPLDKKTARLQRINQLREIYPHWLDVLKREGCKNIYELQERMRWCDGYEPFHSDRGFERGCHPAFGLMDEDTRDHEFLLYVAHWFNLRQLIFTDKSRRILSKARRMADECKAHYNDWIAAQYKRKGKGIMYTHLNSRWAPAIYKRYMANKETQPTCYGSDVIRQWRKEGFARESRGGRIGWDFRGDIETTRESIEEWIKKGE